MQSEWKERKRGFRTEGREVRLAALLVSALLPAPSPPPSTQARVRAFAVPVIEPSSCDPAGSLAARMPPSPPPSSTGILEMP
jgi:hypothetical protein